MTKDEQERLSARGLGRGAGSALLAIAEERGQLEIALRRVTVGLIAAVSLLKAGGKEAVATDLMFSQMIADCERRISDGRAALGGDQCEG